MKSQSVYILNGPGKGKYPRKKKVGNDRIYLYNIRGLGIKGRKQFLTDFIRQNNLPFGRTLMTTTYMIQLVGNSSVGTGYQLIELLGAF